MGYIVPSALLSQNYAKLVRGKILNDCCIETIVDFSNYKVFQEASVPTVIISLEKNHFDNHFIEVVQQKTYLDGIEPKTGENWRINQNVFLTTANQMFRLELVGNTLDIVRHIEDEENRLRLGRICIVITGFVAHDSETGASKDRLINSKSVSAYSKPYVEAKEISDTRYASVYSTRFIEYIPSQMHRPKFPELFESPKLLIQDIVGNSGLLGTIDNSGIYTNHSFNCCVQKHYLEHLQNQRLEITSEDAELSKKYALQFLLGIVNSSTISFYFRSALGGKMHASPENVRSLPLPKINFEDADDKARHDRMVELVEKMLRLKQEHAAVQVEMSDKRHELEEQIAQTDKAIDKLVYDLYGLTDEEIKIVEGG